MQMERRFCRRFYVLEKLKAALLKKRKNIRSANEVYI